MTHVKTRPGSWAALLRQDSAGSIHPPVENDASEKKKVMSTGWQLMEGVAALVVSVLITYWLFVAPSRARRQRQQQARELRDPRDR